MFHIDYIFVINFNSCKGLFILFYSTYTIPNTPKILDCLKHSGYKMDNSHKLNLNNDLSCCLRSLDSCKITERKVITN